MEQVELELANGTYALVTPGVINEAFLDAYTLGNCASLAIVLHQKTGWQYLVGFGYKEEEVHLAVQREDGMVVDACGAQTMEKFEARLVRAWGEELDMFTVEEDGVEEMIAQEIFREGDLELAKSFIGPVLELWGDKGLGVEL